MARPSRIGVTGWSALLLQDGPITLASERDVPFFNVRLEALSGRRPGSSSLQVRPNSPALPKLLRTNEDAVDPQRHCHCLVTLAVLTLQRVIGRESNSRFAVVDSKLAECVTLPD